MIQLTSHFLNNKSGQKYLILCNFHFMKSKNEDKNAHCCYIIKAVHSSAPKKALCYFPWGDAKRYSNIFR